MRSGAIIVALLIVSSLASAQQATRPKPAKSVPELQGVAELNFIMRKLDLDQKQRQHAQGLLDEYETSLSQEVDLTAITGLLHELQQAKGDDDKARIQQLYNEIKANQPSTLARNTFLDGLREILTDQQKVKLDNTLKMLEDNPSGVISLLDIFKAALTLDPTPEQRRELDRIHHQFRTQDVANVGRDGDVPRAGLDTKFSAELRKVLDAPRQEKFDAALKALYGD